MHAKKSPECADRAAFWLTPGAARACDGDSTVRDSCPAGDLVDDRNLFADGVLDDRQSAVRSHDRVITCTASPIIHGFLTVREPCWTAFASQWLITLMHGRLCKRQSAARLGYRSPKFPGRFDPLLGDAFGRRQRLCLGGTIGHAARVLWDFGDERLIFIAPIDGNFVLHGTHSLAVRMRMRSGIATITLFSAFSITLASINICVRRRNSTRPSRSGRNNAKP